MEASRSQMELFADFASRGYPNEIGPSRESLAHPSKIVVGRRCVLVR